MKTTARTSLALALTLTLAGCGGGEQRTASASTPAPSASVAAPVPAATMTGEDPEPPDAQARAEAVVHADFNRDKTKRLVMNISTLVFRTSELEGLASQLAPRENKVEDTLQRLGAKISDTEVRIQLPGSILFDFDSANLRADAERTLTDVVQIIQSYAGRPVRIEGHTDAIASDEYNQTLSERRARTVVDWLAGHGVERGRLASAGLGEKSPVATNDTAAGRQLNRRVEVVIARK